MDEIICANTAFRYWRCPPQVRDLYPRLPNSEDGWRALSQAPFVTEVLKTPIITTTAPGGVNYHSGLRTTIHCEDASGVDSTLETTLGFRVTNPLSTLFTMARFVSPFDLVLAMYEFYGKPMTPLKEPPPNPSLNSMKAKTKRRGNAFMRA